MEKFTELINALDGWLWGLPMIVLLLSGVIAKETRRYLANLDEKDTTEIPVVRRWALYVPLHGVSRRKKEAFRQSQLVL